MKITDTHAYNTIVTIKSDHLSEKEIRLLQVFIGKEIAKHIPIPLTTKDLEDYKKFSKWLGNKIKTQRELLGLSQEKLIEKANLGIKKSTLSQIENGKQSLSSYQYLKIKSVLGKDLDL